MTTPRLDPLIHPLARLSICSALAGAGWAEFATVRDVAGISDSVLSKQARVLEDAGYVEVRKGAAGRRPRTWLRLTGRGRGAFDGHVRGLVAMVPAADSAADSPADSPADFPADFPADSASDSASDSGAVRAAVPDAGNGSGSDGPGRGTLAPAPIGT